MIGYTSVGTNDLPRSAAFYDELLGSFGAQRVFEMPDFIVWAMSENTPAFSVHIPVDGNAATVGNGTMIALSGSSRAQVDEIYKKAIDMGALSEGAPGQRHENGFYAAYFRDPDGNKLNIHFMG